MRILHVAETIKGGPASYINEVAGYQAGCIGSKYINILVPDDQVGELNVPDECSISTYQRTGRNAISLFRFAIKLIEVVKNTKPDVVHLHSSFAGVIGRVLLSKYKVALIYSSHCWAFDRPVLGFFQRVALFVEKKLANRCGAIVNISPHEDFLLKKNDFPMANVVTVVSGIENKENATKLSWGSGDKTSLNLAFVGRFDKQKGLDWLLDAVDSIGEKINLIVVGASVINDRKTNEFRNLENVKFLGWQPREKIPYILQSVDAIVMPSRWEGMPLLALEALREGAVIVASNIGPFPYIVNHGVSGYLFELDNITDFSNAIDALMVANLHQMRKEARKIYDDKFQSSRMNCELLSVYKSVFGNLR